MKKLIALLVIFPLFLSSTNISGTAAQLPCNCGDSVSQDTINVIAQAEARRVDSAITARVQLAADLQDTADSLSAEIAALERQLAKRVLGRTDTWQEPDGRVQEWKWYYIRLSGGTQYDTVIKRTYYGPY